MSNISVAEILKIYGKWIEGKPFAQLVASKKRIGERHAYNLIKKSWNNKEILRYPINGTVLYGLPEFGPPKFENQKDKETLSSDFYNSLVFQFWKERQEVQQLLLRAMPFSAWRKTREFAGIVSSSTKNEQLAEDIKQVNEKLIEIKRGHYVEKNPFTGKPGYMPSLFPDNEQKELLYSAIPKIWEQISVALSNP